jgi:hypothetical protein
VPHPDILAIARSGWSLAEQEVAIRRLLGARDLPADIVLASATAGILLVEEREAPSRIGGPALLPPGQPWPYARDGVPLSFVAALDLAALGAIAPLPTSGTLLIYKNMDDHSGWLDCTRVFHVAGDPRLVEPPAAARTCPPVGLMGLHTLLPGNRDLFDDLPYEQCEAVEELWPRPHDQLLGTSFDVQDSVLDEVAPTLGRETASVRALFTADELAGRGWRLLAQIDQVPGLMFGDAGILYLLVTEVDLESGRFERVLGIVQSV